MKFKTKRKIKKGTRIVTSMIEATGLPHGYSTTVAWFAERLVIASMTLMVLSFAAGVMFVLRLSEPISESVLYDGAVHKAQLAENGIKEISQQVIDVTSPVFAVFIKENHETRDLAAEERLMRKEKLRVYLASKNSPFATDEAALDAFVNSKNMKMMVAISFVESTYGQHCFSYNCSGITGKKGLRKYASYAEWIHDFDDLLERRYKNLPPEDFIGLYVQPGSPNWTYGVKQVLREFEEQGIA